MRSRVCGTLEGHVAFSLATAALELGSPDDFMHLHDGLNMLW